MRKPLVVGLGLFTGLMVMGLAVETSAASVAEVVSVSGDVRARPPAGDTYGRLAVGDRLRAGSRVRTGAGAKAVLQFGDLARVRVHQESEVVVRPPEKSSGGLTVFFGRVWAKVVRATAGKEVFEVQSANAVAGVRGTEFQVGVADNGATRVVVAEGQVAVQDDAGARTVAVSAGYEVESTGHGELSSKSPAKDDSAWSGWFSARARQLEKRGLSVARNLKGRLSRRWKKVQRLVEEQRSLRAEIESLEKRAKRGDDVALQLREKTSKLERVTERLESMQERLRAAFGMFEHWGHMAEEGNLPAGGRIGQLVADSQRIAREFADLVEEGTDLSEEGMEDMLREMKNGGTLRDR